MNKQSKRIVMAIGIVVLFFLIVLIRGCYKSFISPYVDPNASYDIYGQDKYTYFGDGRFQIEERSGDLDGLDRLELLDFSGGGYPSFYVIREIKKYILVDYILYVSGDFSSGTTDLKTGDRIYYSSDQEAPQFMILNIDRGEAEYYLTQEEMSASDRAVFEMDLTGLDCLKERTCYEKGADTEPSWSEVFSRIIENAFSW